MNKKGMDISLNFIILAVLALIALIIIALIFTGGLTNLFSQQEEVGSVSAEKIALAKAECNLFCTINNRDSWDRPDLPEDVIDQFPAGCDDLLPDKTWTNDDKCVEE